GDWYKIGAPDLPEDPHLALVPDNINPNVQNISCGTSVSGLTGWRTFTPQTSGTHNRDFSQVTSDGAVYCYDNFVDPLGQPAFTGYYVLITMPSATTLEIERVNTANCGGGPWSMSGNAVTFQR
ncbi:MAG: hypothetical protein JO102_04745, partial [Elusimicrobia bacterium]|nr:hypothetical protein [Elusimicrobiota bacterium]